MPIGHLKDSELDSHGLLISRFSPNKVQCSSAAIRPDKKSVPIIIPETRVSEAIDTCLDGRYPVGNISPSGVTEME